MTNTDSEPLYDANQPIACTIDARDIAAHIEVIERIRQQLARIERTAHGVVLDLPPTPANIADLHQFVAEEKRCCAFWGFDLEQHTDQVRLRWDGPPDTATFMEHLVDYLEGRLPIGALFGSP